MMALVYFSKLILSPSLKSLTLMCMIYTTPMAFMGGVIR